MNEKNDTKKYTTFYNLIGKTNRASSVFNNMQNIQFLGIDQLNL